MSLASESIDVPRVEDVRLATLEEVLRFATDTHNYTRFDLTLPEFSDIYGCIDARSVIPPFGKKNKTIIQTAGGGGGEVDDLIVAEAARTGELLTPDEALGRERRLRGTTTLGGHKDCKFETAQPVIKAEEVDPSNKTLDNVERTLYRYNRHRIVMPLMPAIFQAAGEQLKNFSSYGIPHDFHKNLDKVYSGKRNVADMFGENKAQVYAVNHSTRVGLDRDKKARILIKDRVDIQLYHESRGAAIANLTNAYANAENLPESLGPDPSQKELQRALDFRLGAFVLRSCATETVLTGLRPTRKLEITHTTHGLDIRETE